MAWGGNLGLSTAVPWMNGIALRAVKSRFDKGHAMSVETHGNSMILGYFGSVGQILLRTVTKKVLSA